MIQITAKRVFKSLLAFSMLPIKDPFRYDLDGFNLREHDGIEQDRKIKENEIEQHTQTRKIPNEINIYIYIHRQRRPKTTTCR